MATNGYPDYIGNKARQLRDALNKVNALSGELSEWAAKKSGDDELDIITEYNLDNPYEFDFTNFLDYLDWCAHC